MGSEGSVGTPAEGPQHQTTSRAASAPALTGECPAWGLVRNTRGRGPWGGRWGALSWVSICLPSVPPPPPPQWPPPCAEKEQKAPERGMGLLPCWAGLSGHSSGTILGDLH